MRSKHVFSMLMAFFAFMLFSMQAYAAPAPEDQSQTWQKDLKEHKDAIRPLLQQRFKKMEEMQQLIETGIALDNPKVTALQKEIAELDVKISTLRMRFATKYGSMHQPPYHNPRYYGPHGGCMENAPMPPCPCMGHRPMHRHGYHGYMGGYGPMRGHCMENEGCPE